MDRSSEQGWPAVKAPPARDPKMRRLVDAWRRWGLRLTIRPTS